MKSKIGCLINHESYYETYCLRAIRAIKAKKFILIR